VSHHYPVDNATYNLMQALVSKLEAIEVYEKYSRDDDSGLFQELMQEEQQHAQRLLQALEGRMGGQGGGSSTGGGQG
jgi:rubrerythrin